MKLISTILLLLVSLSGSGQTGRTDNDSLACLNSLSVMSEFARLGLYEEAYDSWKYCFINCPSQSRNIYITGPLILYEKIEKSSDTDLRKGYIDTLLLMYDIRIKYFGQEGYVSARKAVDILKYRPAEYPEAYMLLKKSVAIEKLNTEAVSIAGFMQATIAMYRNGRIDAGEAVANYFEVMDIIYAGNTIADDRKDNLAASVSGLIAEIGTSGCDAAAEYLKNSSLKINPKIVPCLLSFSEKAGCDNAELISRIASGLGEGTNNSDVTLMLAVYFNNLQDWDNAAVYYYKALETGLAPDRLPEVYYNLSVVELQRQNYPQVRAMAMTALEYRPLMGEAYISIGLAYAASAEQCGNSGFEKGAVYWAAVDKFEKARETGQEAALRADELIAVYSKYFPDKETIFFSGHSPGEEYFVGCWINENTIIR